MSRTLMTQGEPLSLRDLEQQDIELLPDREEMSLITVGTQNTIHTGGVLNGSFHYVNNSVDVGL